MVLIFRKLDAAVISRGKDNVFAVFISLIDDHSKEILIFKVTL